MLILVTGISHISIFTFCTRQMILQLLALNSDDLVQLTLPAGVGSSTVDVKVMWSGNGINHLLSSIMQQTNGTCIHS